VGSRRLRKRREASAEERLFARISAEPREYACQTCIRRSVGSRKSGMDVGSYIMDNDAWLLLEIRIKQLRTRGGGRRTQ
jgi:hypothetical protein